MGPNPMTTPAPTPRPTRRPTIASTPNLSRGPTRAPTPNPTAAQSPRQPPSPTKASAPEPSPRPTAAPLPDPTPASASSPSPAKAPPPELTPKPTGGSFFPTNPSGTSDASILRLSGIAMKLVGVGELVLEDWEVFEAITESWCERYFAENSAQTRVYGFKTNVGVTSQDVAPATTSPQQKISNTLSYAQTIEYYVADENTIIDPEALVTEPFRGVFRNQAYLETLARNSSAFAGINTQVITIPQLQKSDLEGSSGSSRIIIGVIVGLSVVVLLSGFVVYRSIKSGRNQEQHAQQQEPDAGIQDSPPTRRTAISEVTPVAPVARQPPSIVEIGGSNVQRMAGPPQFLLQYKDQARSVEENVSENAVPFAAIRPAAASRLEPTSLDA